MLKLLAPQPNIFIPDNAPFPDALKRTTHLCIGAHQDDLEILAYHGIQECFKSQKNWFTGIVVTSGKGSPRSGVYQKTSDIEMVDIRIQEQKKAAFIGEYAAQIQLGYSSEMVKDNTNQDSIEDLAQILEICKPEVVYLHNPADKHDSHVAVLLRSISAIHKLPKNKRPKVVYGCEVWRSLDWLLDEDKVALPVDQYSHLAHALIAVFDSQISGGKRYDLATIGRRQANATYYNPHATDSADAMTWAIDLTPIIADESISLEEYTLDYIEKLKKDVTNRIQKFKA